VNVLALRTLHEEHVPVPRAFTRLIGEAAKVRDGRPDDVERESKLERLGSRVEVGEKEGARRRVLRDVCC
jgi:hypothetical protein